MERGSVNVAMATAAAERYQGGDLDGVGVFREVCLALGIGPELAVKLARTWLHSERIIRLREQSEGHPC